MTIVLVTGGFDPLHSGHIAYFEAAKKLGDQLVVGINSDAWLVRKKGRAFMPLKERIAIVKNLKNVDWVMDFNDEDDTANNAISKLIASTSIGSKIIFANGGDRTKDNIPEMNEWPNVDFVFGVGGEVKQNSSSWILEEWKNPKTIRNWGWYRVLDDKAGYKVKELVIEPGKSLSMQRHQDRSEHWYILKGTCLVNTINISSDFDELGRYKENQSFTIHKRQWHQGCNETKEPCHILEVQYGDRCVEDDIERRS
jgi:D-beta-D-heptose 7-phosphate kinase/D-beta-D-heptose 1-phosphate adenosyltransferase